MIYVDLLVIEDLILNYVIIISTGILLNRITRFKKVFLSSVIGTIPLILLFVNINSIYIFIHFTKLHIVHLDNLKNGIVYCSISIKTVIDLINI